MGTPGKRVYLQGYRGFESLPVRHFEFQRVALRAESAIPVIPLPFRKPPLKPGISRRPSAIPGSLPGAEHLSEKEASVGFMAITPTKKPVCDGVEFD